MAQLVLSNVGAAVGQRLLPQGVNVFGRTIAGAAIGQAVGSVAGAAIDAAVFAPRTEGARIRDYYLTGAREGAAIPLVYGRMRVGGQLIWAARYRERRETGGGKQGGRTTQYLYSLSFAVGLCEGVASRISRAWANGEPLDLSAVTHRFYPGDEAQAPDPLIEAIEGEGAAPAYRGLAYVVFEDMPLDAYGDRLPQLSFEIVRPMSDDPVRLEASLKGVNLIPGAGEFALATEIVRRRDGPGREVAENAHSGEARADLLVSLDQLAADLPAVKRVNLVVGWFGDDLRAGECRIAPGVEIAEKDTAPWNWSVSGVERGAARLVSRTPEGRPAYGGTPDDRSVVQAIRELKARGYHVTLYPFLFMDIPEGSGKPDPSGGVQKPHPWRGRISCDPAPGLAGSADRTAAAGAQIAAFFGGAAAGDFAFEADGARWLGGADAGYRRFILHCAGLARAGGADGLLVGSEMVGLTRVRDETGGFPAVERLVALARDVRAILGPEAEVSYAADWTEYGGQVLAGGDLAFPLDALWADPAVSHVGVDFYPPMADWRDGNAHADAGWGSVRNRAYLADNLTGGEAFDWYYADANGRAAQERLEISDGAHGEPFVFRPKDLSGWWLHAHHPRLNGVRQATPTAWTPGMKPVRLVEFGCPAVDKGANQPNLFFAPGSSESALPYGSSGARDDLVQRRMLEAVLAGFAPGGAANAVSPATGAPMTPADGLSAWAWDARPFPAFPLDGAAWGDAANWRLGHWLNGRMSAAEAGLVAGDIARRAGTELDAEAAEGLVSGYVLEGPVTARRALEPLMAAAGLGAADHDGRIRLVRRDGATAESLEPDLVDLPGGDAFQRTRERGEVTPVRLRLSFIDAGADYGAGVVETDGDGQAEDVVLPLAMDRDAALELAGQMAGEQAAARETARMVVSPLRVDVGAGVVVEAGGRSWRVTEAADAGVRTLSLVGLHPRTGLLASATGGGARPAEVETAPDFLVIDAPPLPGEEADARPLAAVFVAGGAGTVRVTAGRSGGRQDLRGEAPVAAVTGRLAWTLWPCGFSGRWSADEVEATLTGEAASATLREVLDGANLLLVETAAGWELTQFREAALVAPGRYRLKHFLRGQQGSEAQALAGAPAGSRIVLVDRNLARLSVGEAETGMALAWRAGRRAPDGVAAAVEAVWRGRAAAPWSPAQLRAWADGAGGAMLGWVPRSGRGGDGWDEAEPLVEAPERWRVELLAEGMAVRSWETAAREAVYPADWRTADLPAGGEAVFRVRRLAATGAAGPAAETRIWF